MLGDWRNEKGTRLTDVIKKSMSNMNGEYDFSCDLKTCFSSNGTSEATWDRICTLTSYEFWVAYHPRSFHHLERRN